MGVIAAFAIGLIFACASVEGVVAWVRGPCAGVLYSFCGYCGWWWGSEPQRRLVPVSQCRRLPRRGLFTQVPRETVRKVSDMAATWPVEPTKRCFSARFGLGIPTKSTLAALLVPLFGQFLEGEFCELRV